MMPIKSLWSALTASVAVHAFVGYAMTASDFVVHAPPAEPIRIDYVRTEKKLPDLSVDKKTTKEKPVVLRKKIKGIPVPRIEATDFQKAVDEKIKKQLLQLKQLEKPEPEKSVSSSMTSAELLADPVKGRVFIAYFGQVKKKIQDTVFQKAKRNLYGRGSVCLGFVLNAQGQLERLGVLTNGTDADDSMKELAAQCIRDSAPFGEFPKDLGLRRILLNITIFFDGTE